MKLRFRIGIAVLAAAGTVVAFRLLVGDSVVALFSPRGAIAGQERDVIVKSVVLMLVAALPVLALLFGFAWKYRAGNERAAYEPDEKHGVMGELMLWIAPAVVVAVLGSIAWTSTHALDPYAPIAAEKPTMTVQVIALRWKWLFIYPEQGIATVNLLEFPEGTPVHLELTADGPMSSFWIPRLGTQIYAMSAMQTQLNLLSNSVGDYPGRNMEINGEGYSGMTFTARVASQEDFDAWVAGAKAGSGRLDRAAYDLLARPSEDVPPALYSRVDPDLYRWVLTKDLPPEEGDGGMGM